MGHSTTKKRLWLLARMHEMILKRPRFSGPAWWATVVMLALVLLGATLAAASKMTPFTAFNVS